MIERLNLRVIAPNRPARTVKLQTLAADDLVISDSKDNCTSVDLTPLLNFNGGEHRLTLYRGMTPVLPNSLTFFLLPEGVKVESPSSDLPFSESRPPSALVHGVTADQLEVDPGAILRAEIGGIRIIWNDPHAPCRVILRWGNQTIPLVWAAHWSYAWVEPLNPDGRLWKDELHDVSLHIRGAPKGAWTLYTGEAERTIYLNAHGLYELDALARSIK